MLLPASCLLPGYGPRRLTIMPSGVNTLWYFKQWFRLCPEK